MQKRVIFTSDEREGVISKKNAKKLYSRITIGSLKKDIFNSIKLIIEKSEDPLIRNINLNSNNEDDESDLDINELSKCDIIIDLLVFESGDYVQYTGAIKKETISNLRESGLSKEIKLDSLYIWIYGILLIGDYDDGKSYKFAFNEQGQEHFWSIKLLHSGIFKIILSLKLTKKLVVDLDEYFIEDLECYYLESIEHNNEKKRMNNEFNRMLVEINKLKDKTIIEKLKNSVNLMKKRITNYFLPLINHLNNENNALRKSGSYDNGDTVFISSRRKRKFENGDTQDAKELRVEDSVKTENQDSDFGDEFVERERNKRLKYKEMREKNDTQVETKEEQTKEKIKKDKNPITRERVEDQKIKDFYKDEDSDNEIVTKRNNIVQKMDTQPNIVEVYRRIEKHDTTGRGTYSLEEDTQLDDQTDISNDKTDVSENEVNANANASNQHRIENAGTDKNNNTYTNDELTEMSE